VKETAEAAQRRRGPVRRLRRWTIFTLAVALLVGVVVQGMTFAVGIRSEPDSRAGDDAASDFSDYINYGFLGCESLIMTSRGAPAEYDWGVLIGWFEERFDEQRGREPTAGQHAVRVARTRALRATAWMILAVGAVLAVASLILAA
jgi:predicted anti-sigma-YlaC factor YlaD